MSAKIKSQNGFFTENDLTTIDSYLIIRYYKKSTDRKNNSLISAKKMREIVGKKSWKKAIINRIDQVWETQTMEIKLRRGIMFRIAYR